MNEDICQCETPSQEILSLSPYKTNPNCSNCGKRVTMESIRNAIRIGKKKWLQK